MKKLARFLYQRIRLRGIPVFCNGQVDADLTGLGAGADIEKARADYYSGKIALTLLILLTGAVLGLAAKVSARENALLPEGGLVVREGAEGGTRHLLLSADDGENRRSFRVEVEPRELTREEAESYFDAFLADADKFILGRNEDLGHVMFDMVLRENYENMPLQAVWESDRPDLLDSDGTVQEVSGELDVELTVTLKCGAYSRTEPLHVTLVPPVLSQEEKDYREMQQFLSLAEEDSRVEESFRLPEIWKGKSITWTLETKDYSVLIWIAAPVVALSIFLMSDRDLHAKLEKKREQMHREYPDIVHRLALYVGAGMTIRGAFQKMSRDYVRKEKKGGAKPGYEELLYTCRELETGVPERTAYEHFGRRTGLREYIKLCTLLGQNLKRGNSALLERLHEEAENASQETLLQVRKTGEEAGTKILVPMVMMLGVVMVMILVPAFGTM